MITIIISNYNKKNNILTVPLDISVDLLVGAGDEVEEALPAVRGKYLKTIPPSDKFLSNCFRTRIALKKIGYLTKNFNIYPKIVYFGENIKVLGK